MIRIEITQTFSHAGQPFHAGEIRHVSEQDAGYFCGVGWAKSAEHPTGTPDLSDKTLEVQSVTHATSGENVNG